MPSRTRREVLTTLGSASLALAGCPRGRPTGDLGSEGGGRWSVETPATPGGVAAGPTNPETVWTSERSSPRAGTPAVSNGQLYVPVDAISDTARHRYRIHALSAATGDERWQVPLRSEPNAPPAVSGDHIVVTAQRALEQGRIVCFQTRYGNEDWLVDIDAKLCRTDDCKRYRLRARLARSRPRTIDI